MSTIPKPPGFTSNRTPKTSPDPVPQPDQDVDEDVVAFVIRTTLLPQHRVDPNILKFIDSYMLCREARQAAREAGLPPQAGPNLLKKHDIFDCISKLTQKLVMKYGYDASEIVERVKEVASVDPIEVYNSDGSYKKLHEIAPEARRAIKKMKVKNTYFLDPNNQIMKDPVTGKPVVESEIIEIDFGEKLKAAELLGREKNLFKESKVITHDVGSNMRNILLESKDRANARLNQMRDITPQIGARLGEEKTTDITETSEED